jgi:hypothetical protein
MLKDEDIQYVVDPHDGSPMPDLNEELVEVELAIDENYIEAKPQKVSGHNLTEADLKAHLQYCKDTGQDGDFYTVEGAHHTYDAKSGEATMHGYQKLPAACKFFSPSQVQIDALNAQVARDYKYDRAFSQNACCQSRHIESPFCIAANNHSDCIGYQPEEWIPVRLATGKEDEKLEWNRGRLYNGVPYERITQNNSIVSAATGDERKKLDSVWETAVEQTAATEQPLPEPGPKNPYLQSLLV